MMPPTLEFEPGRISSHKVRSLYTKLAPWRTEIDKRQEAITEAFVDRFFDDMAELEYYREEFEDGPAVSICGEAMESIPEDTPIFDIHMEECKRYYSLVRKLSPDVLVETGVLNGISTLGLLIAIDANGCGTLYSIDSMDNATDYRDRNDHRRRTEASCAQTGSEQIPTGREPGWIVPADFDDYWEFRRGHSVRELPHLLAELDHVDFFLHDSEHSLTTMAFELVLAWEWLRPGGVIVSHHAGWNDTFDRFGAEHDCDFDWVFWRPPKRGEGMSLPRECKYLAKPSTTSTDRQI